MSRRVPVQVAVNGVAREGYVEARRTLVDFLREDLELTGTHVGCEHGVCGACTVLLDGEPVRSCLMFAVQAEGCAITTIEGLTGPQGELHPLQAAFRDNHSFQCGFCTPGFMMTAMALLDEAPLSDERLRQELSSNLCRCTGYQSIVAGVRDAFKRVHSTRPEGS
ncbi:MAG: (2Fe-2S)-binding protein [Acidimicrobiaceae bacterium]|nr:(2Fe-2S)-binding protein [Acidimicrobiaceae bacterium]